LRDLGDDLVERRIDETVELDLDDGPIAAERQPHRGPDDPRLGERRIDHPSGAELVEQTVGDAEDAAERTDVLAQEDDVVIVAHRLPQPRAQRPAQGQRLTHAVTASSNEARYAAYS